MRRLLRDAVVIGITAAAVWLIRGEAQQTEPVGYNVPVRITCQSVSNSPLLGGIGRVGFTTSMMKGDDSITGAYLVNLDADCTISPGYSPLTSSGSSGRSSGPTATSTATAVPLPTFQPTAVRTPRSGNIFIGPCDTYRVASGQDAEINGSLPSGTEVHIESRITGTFLVAVKIMAGSGAGQVVHVLRGCLGEDGMQMADTAPPATVQPTAATDSAGAFLVGGDGCSSYATSPSWSPEGVLTPGTALRLTGHSIAAGQGGYMLWPVEILSGSRQGERTYVLAECLP
jgi:hypothetical protein